MTPRQMKNVRTGKVAAYDAELVESGRWEEITVAAAAKEEPKKAVVLKKLKGIGTLQVTPQEAKHEGVIGQT